MNIQAENGVLQREKKIGRLWIGAFFSVLFVIIYVFFRYVHPIVPWNGDDWRTVMEWGIPYIPYKVNYVIVNYNIILNFLGPLFGDIAAFVIYPITGDYVGALIAANALAKALFITILLFAVWKFLNVVTGNEKISLTGTMLFLFISFVILYDMCTVYAYSIPSYCAVAFSLYMINRYITDKQFKLNLKTTFALAGAYFVMFSFFNASVFITIVAVTILLYDMIAHRRFFATLRDNWFYVVILALFPLKFYEEFLRTFATGYFSAPSEVIEKFKISLLSLLRLIKQTNGLFKAVTVLGLCGVFFLAVRERKTYDRDKCGVWVKLFVILFVSLIAVALFFAMFGVVSIQYIVMEDGRFRVDAMFVLLFSVILFVVLLWSLLMQKNSRITVLLPVLMCMMLNAIVYPYKAYSESYYEDTTAKQKYTIMSEVVEEACKKDVRGEDNLVVHMPAYGHYMTDIMGWVLYSHNLTDRSLDIQFQYNAEFGDLWFE